ncbi:MAG: esterase/lipase family protein, partial [Pseudobdellovibrionaceae bacterium]
KTLRARPLTPEDKISIVAHSQGGIIAYMWFFDHLMREPRDIQFAKQVDSIITLGTPFWGSKLASILIDPTNVDLIPFIKAFGGSEYRMSRREITDMAFGSDVVHSFRKMAVQLDMDPEFNKKLRSLPVRLINLTGIMPQDKNKIFSSPQTSTVSSFTKKMINFVYRLFARNNANGGRVESDIAVTVPSSRWDFIYTPPKQVTSDLQISSAEFRNFENLVKRSKFIYSETVHLPFESENTFSMAYINQSCLQVETCNHPTFRYILEQLANCPENSCDPQAFNDVILKMKVVNIDQHLKNRNLQSTLHSFAIQIGVKLKAGSIDRFPVKYFKKGPINPESDQETWVLNQPELIGKVLNLKRDKNQRSVSSNKNYTVFIGKKSETQSIDIVSKAATQNEFYDTMRINVIGSIRFAGDVDEDVVVPLEVNLPGLPRVKVDTLVRPGYSTYLDLDYSNSPE